MIVEYLGNKELLSCFGMEMYKQIPSELQPLLDSGRLLIISTSNSPRQSKATALSRNRYICEIADQILLVGVNENSSLYDLSIEFQSKYIK